MSDDRLTGEIQQTRKAVEDLGSHIAGLASQHSSLAVNVADLRKQHESISLSLVEMRTTLQAAAEKVDQLERVMIRGNGVAPMTTRVYSLEERLAEVKARQEKVAREIEERDREARRGRIGVWTALIAAFSALGAKAIELLAGGSPPAH